MHAPPPRRPARLVRRARLVVLGLLAGALLVPAATARADSPEAGPSRPGWAFGSPPAEGVVLGLALASNLTFFVPQHRGTWNARHRHAWVPSLGLASDVIGAAAGSALQLGTGYLFESGYLASGGARHPGAEALHGSLVEAEALALTNGVTTLIKKLTGRCRPRAYWSGTCDEFDAFPSGHTSPIAAFAGARLVRVFETPFHDPSAGLRLASLGVAEAALTATAVLRVASGAHSVEDVLVGALLGHAVGVLVAVAHPPEASPKDAVSVGAVRQPFARPFVISWGGRF